jgi:hypothetical protein
MLQPTLTEILRSGEQLYFEKLKGTLEKESYGQYVVIDTETKEYIVDEHQLHALESAKAKFGNKLFFIVQIGSLDTPTLNHRNYTEYAWSI